MKWDVGADVGIVLFPLPEDEVRAYPSRMNRFIVSLVVLFQQNDKPPSPLHVGHPQPMRGRCTPATENTEEEQRLPFVSPHPQ